MTQLSGMAAPPLHSGAITAQSLADVQNCIRGAAAGGIRVVGAGTWLGAGRPVFAPAAVSIRSLAGIVEYVPGDLTITVWAGTSLAELDAAVAEHGQWIALDPFGARDGTLGATVATASNGPLAASFGTPRDVVLGVQCVTGDGEIVHGGARVVKHVAGFDMVRLMTGAWGTLGVITQLTVRLRAKAAVDKTFVVALGAATLRDWFPRYRAATLAPLAAELLAGMTASSLGLGSEMCALIRVSGNDEAVTAQETVLRELGTVRAAPDDVWARFAANEPAAPAAALRLSQRVAHMPEVWERATELVHGVPNARLHATLDRGVARVVLPQIAPADFLARLNQPARVPLTRICEVLPEDLWARVAPSPTAAATPLAQRIRAAFDPEHLLNPGILGEPNA